MRVLLLFSCLLSIGYLLRGQTLNGIVYHSFECDNEHNVPLSGVSISCDGTNTISRTDGTFTLELPNKVPGDKLNIVFKKTGYYVQSNATVNLSNKTTSVELFLMCKNNTSVSNNTLQERFSMQMREIQEELENIRVQQRQQTKDSPEYKEIERNKNQLEAKLKNLNELVFKLRSESRELKWQDTIDEIDNVINKILHKSKNKSNSILTEENIELLIQILCDYYVEESLSEDDYSFCKKIRNYFYLYNGNYKKAEENIKAILNKEPDNIEAIMDYVLILSILDRSVETIDYLKKAINVNDDKFREVEIRIELAENYSIINNFDEAEIQLYRAEKNILSIKPDTNTILRILDLKTNLYTSHGDILWDFNKYDEAEKKYLQAKKLYSDESENNNQLNPALASIYESLGNLYKVQYKFQEAQDSYTQALNIYHIYLELDYESYISDYSDVLMSMVELSEKKNDLGNATLLLNRLETTYDLQSNTFPSLINSYLAKLYVAQGRIFQKNERYIEALSKYFEAKKRYLSLSKDFPNAYDEAILDIKERIGLTYLAQGKYKFSKSELDSVRHKREAYATKASDTNEHGLADIYFSMGIYYNTVEKYDSAYVFLARAKNLYQKKEASSERIYLPLILKCSQMIALNHSGNNKTNLAKKELSSTYQLAKRLVKLDNVVFTHKYAITLLELGLVYMNETEYNLALEKFEEALSIYDQLVKKQKNAYEEAQAQTLLFIGQVNMKVESTRYLAQNHFERASGICNKQLEENQEIFNPLLADIEVTFAQLNTLYRKYAVALDFLESAQKRIEEANANNPIVKYQINLINIKKRKASIYREQGMYDEAIRELNRAKVNCKSLIASASDFKDKYVIELAELEEECGDIYIDSNSNEKYRKARKSYDKAKELLTNVGFSNEIYLCRIDRKIGEVVLHTNDKETALSTFKEIIKKIHSINNCKDLNLSCEEELAKLYFNIGGIEFDNADHNSFELSREAFLESKKIYNELSSYGVYYKINAINCLINIGLLHINQHDNSKAIGYFESALTEAKELYSESSEGKKVYATVHRHIGETYLRIKLYDNAADYLEKSLENSVFKNNMTDQLSLADLKKDTGKAIIRSSSDPNKGENLLIEARSICAKYINYPKAKKIYTEICEDIDCN